MEMDIKVIKKYIDNVISRYKIYEYSKLDRDYIVVFLKKDSIKKIEFNNENWVSDSLMVRIENNKELKLPQNEDTIMADFISLKIVCNHEKINSINYYIIEADKKIQLYKQYNKSKTQINTFNNLSQEIFDFILSDLKEELILLELMKK